MRSEISAYLHEYIQAQMCSVNMTDSEKYDFLQLFLGMYPDEHFIEKPVKEAMVQFRKKLGEVTKVIKNRNEGKKLPYYYLSPDRIPNSVAV